MWFRIHARWVTVQIGQAADYSISVTCWVRSPVLEFASSPRFQVLQVLMLRKRLKYGQVSGCRRNA